MLRALLSLSFVLSLHAKAQACDERLFSAADALPDRPLSAVIPAMKAALDSCGSMPPDLHRALQAAFDSMREPERFGPPISIDAAINAKLGQLHRDWWDAICQPDEAHQLSMMEAYLKRTGAAHTQNGALYDHCRLGRLGLLSEAEFAHATGTPLFAIYLAQWMQKSGQSPKRVLHVVRAFSAPGVPQAPAAIDAGLSEEVPLPPPPPPAPRSKSKRH